MEKIKQALERARREKADEAPDARTDQVANAKPGAIHSVKPISYKDTKVLAIDHEIFRRNRIVIGTRTSGPAETAYKILRTQIEQRLAARNWNAIAITSPGPAAGKTITAINLAMALAQEVHRTVLLVDLDFRNPSVHKRFEYGVDYGLIDYLLDDVPLKDILVNPGIERLVILPAGGKPVPNSSELLSSPKMIELVDELKSRYPSRIIVFDLPPLLWSDDTIAFSPYVDTTLMVVSEGLTTREEFKRALEILEGSEVIGTVLNRSSEIQPTYYHK